MSNENNSGSSAQTMAMVAYVLYLLGVFTGFFWLGGLLLAFVFRGKPDNSQLATKHFEHQVRFGVKLLIVGIVASVLAVLLAVSVIGALFAWIPLLVWFIWALVVVVKGLVALAGNREPS